jgi:hydrogenase maturation protein HypF
VAAADRPVARTIRVRGVVQGVGFRPFVHELAAGRGLAGSVRNRAGDVVIEVEGAAATIDRFVSDLVAWPPPLARIDAVESAARPARGERGFVIAPSEDGDPGEGGLVGLPADAATCDDCLGELADPADRRHGYAFISCTRCGPRLTIVTGAPLDRGRTTMAAFPLCPACQAEYDDPADRRFHAQATCCPACGPHLRAHRGDGVALPGDPLERAAAAIAAGQIVAIKGIGGYHLACDAASNEAVAGLRQRKVRAGRPFAVMVGDLAAAERLAALDEVERAALTSPARPIVLCARRREAPLTEAVAPGSHLVGLLLPYAPVHHLLAARLGRPIVLTSGNRADEPIAHRDDEAAVQLAGLADLVLDHDRAIDTRCDDSVVRVVAGVAVPLRRSRGHAPAPVALPDALAVPTLALGGHLKNAFALGVARRAVIGHHVGDLDHATAHAALLAAIERYERVHGVAPTRLVHDRHPDYATTRYAEARAARDGLARVAVQHHHAHLASLLAEHRAAGPAIGLCFDGAGLGDDGAIWGGEVLVGDAAAVRRAAHLAYVPLPGGEAAQREPWRMALAHLRAAGGELAGQPLADRVPLAERRRVERLLDRPALSPPTSSMGRLFDAVAALVGAAPRASFEGEAAMWLESLATGEPAAGPYPYTVAERGGTLTVDCGPIVLAVAGDVTAGRDPRAIARRFHAAVVELSVDLCLRLRASTGVATVGLTCGVFANAILTAEIAGRLAAAGFAVLRHRVVPPGDGGLCLGQLAVVAARDAAAAARS